MSPALLSLLPPAALAWYAARLLVRQDALVFRPARGRARPAAAWPGCEQVRLPGPGGVVTGARWLPARAAAWTVVYFHGSDGNVARELPVARFLAELGVSALLVEYPGYGDDGTRPSERRCYLAADAGWEFVTGSAPPHRIILFGHSLGGAVAAYLAARVGCGGLVIHSGFTSVPDLAARRYPYLPVRPFCRTRMDSTRRLARHHAPLLMIHSADDEHIPIDNARRLYRWAPGPKRFVTLRGPHRGSAWSGHPEVRAAWSQLLHHETATWDGG